MKTLLKSALVMCAIVTGIANAATKKVRTNVKRVTAKAKLVKVVQRTTGGCANGQCRF
jgi:hypothetical protein